MSTPRHWLMKSEPEVFSIKDLRLKGKSLWDGVRNYQARNFMMKDMAPNDLVVFYHSNGEPSGPAGIARVTKSAVPDPSQFNPKSEYFEPRAKRAEPVWYCVEVEFAEEFTEVLSLTDIRENPELADLPLLKKGNRLSIQPLTPEQFKKIVELAGHRSKGRV
jgi:predicted RNA-binding protein with PUA-like domain